VLSLWCLQSQQCKYRCRSLYSSSPRCCPVKCHLQRTHFHSGHFEMNHYDYMNFVAQKASPQGLSCQQNYISLFIQGKCAKWKQHAFSIKLACMWLSKTNINGFYSYFRRFFFVSCINLQTFQSLWPQKSWQKYCIFSNLIRTQFLAIS
jgi:hypothetical protein